MASSDRMIPTRAESLGWHKKTEEQRAKQIEWHRASIHEVLTNRPPGVKWWEVSRKIVGDYEFLLIHLYFSTRDAEAGVAARELVKWTREYFFGEWRRTAPSGNYRDQPPDPKYHRHWATWQSQYVNGVVWASVIGDWQAVEEISRYPTDEVRLDVDQSLENRAWLLTLAGVLRGEPPSAFATHICTVRQGRRKREKLLLDLLLAIASGEQAAAADASSAYFGYYLKAERRQELMMAKCAYDGTLMVNLAQQRGLQLPVPPNAEQHLIRLRI